MDFALNDEQQMLADAVGRWLSTDYAFEARQRLLAPPPGTVPAHWAQLADLGLLGLLVPAEHGGLGAGPAELMVVMQSFGRALVIEPYASTAVLAVSLIARSANASQQADWLPAIVEGRKRWALAVLEAGGGQDWRHIATRAEPQGTGWRINGRKLMVMQADTADRLIVVARTRGSATDTDGLSLFAVDANVPGLRARHSPTIDGMRCSDLEFGAVQVPAAALVGELHGGYAPLEWAVDRGLMAACAEALGAMEALCEQTAAYLRDRKQFGRALAEQQALQHRLADMLIATEQARGITLLAVARVDGPDPLERRRALAAAKSLVGRCGRAVGQAAVQLHGGMGMTDELPIGHYFKRLTAIDIGWGNSAHHLKAFGDCA